jgi:hypothetical protein
VVALGAGFILALAAAAATTPRAVSVTLAAPVRHLAADAHGVAVHTRAPAGCDTILLWQPPAKPTKVAAENCQQPSTGAGVTSLALYGRRPAWVGYAGGNDREFSVSTIVRKRPTYVSFHPVPVEDSASVHWRVAPGSGVLAFEENGALWRVSPGGGGVCPYPYLPKVCVRVPGSGTLLGVGGGRLLVRTADGVSLLRQDGTVVKTSPDAPDAVTDGNVVVELANGRLTSGSRAVTVPRSSHLAGIAHGLVAVTHGSTTLVVRLRDGKQRSFPGSVAALSEFGLYTASGTRLTFTPAAALGL